MKETEPQKEKVDKSKAFKRTIETQNLEHAHSLLCLLIVKLCVKRACAVVLATHLLKHPPFYASSDLSGYSGERENYMGALLQSGPLKKGLKDTFNFPP